MEIPIFRNDALTWGPSLRSPTTGFASSLVCYAATIALHGYGKKRSCKAMMHFAIFANTAAQASSPHREPPSDRSPASHQNTPDLRRCPIGPHLPNTSNPYRDHCPVD